MEHLLTYHSEVNDESLHIAARQLDYAAIKLLLKHHARTDVPGTVHCESRIPLAELCRMADVTRNPAQLKKTLALVYRATTNLKILNHGKSIIFQALENNTPFKMVAALLGSCSSIQDSLNDNFNIFSTGSYRYSPAAYVRHFMCIESLGHRSLNLVTSRCCAQSDCPAPKLENILHAHGCKDRFWDAHAGADQPEGFCNPPPAIITAIEEAKTARKEETRGAKKQRVGDAEVEAESRREQERLILQGQKTALELRTLQERAAEDVKAIRRRAEAEEQERQRLADIEAENAEARRRREQREHEDEEARKSLEFEKAQEREARKSRQVISALREKSNIQVDQRKRRPISRGNRGGGRRRSLRIG